MVCICVAGRKAISKLKRPQEAHGKLSTTTTNMFDDSEEGDKRWVYI